MTKFVILVISIVCIGSCTGNRNVSDRENIIREWSGKKIIFPSEIDTFNNRQDFNKNDCTKFKIVVYTDSIGCTSCKLQLYRWNTFIKKVSKSGLVSFYFYFQTNDKQFLSSILKRDNFKLPVFIDKDNAFANVNKISNVVEYQCFLLDEDDRVVLIGNPILNPKIRELFERVLQSKEDGIDSSLTAKTTVEVKESVVELDNLENRKESFAKFVLLNTGDVPLCIYDITAGCGCVIPEWNKELVRPKEEIIVTVKVIPESVGYFNKKITVHCNVKGGAIRFTVKGMVNK